MFIEILKDYIIELEQFDINLIKKEIAEKGIDKFLSQQLIYLDCSRIINDMRMMQTIGYPYKAEISKYLYALDMIENNNTKISLYKDKLLAIHALNLAYEKDNPPIWYDKEKIVNTKKENKHPRRRKVKEQTIPGFGKEVTASQSLKSKLAGCANVKFTLKPPKK